MRCQQGKVVRLWQYYPDLRAVNLYFNTSLKRINPVLRLHLTNGIVTNGIGVASVLNSGYALSHADRLAACAAGGARGGLFRTNLLTANVFLFWCNLNRRLRCRDWHQLEYGFAGQ